jgi:NAD(P)-dependent dehydrogenase (short-subunit alcohol dehydrogenase family)
MARVLVTGSTAGIGLQTVRQLLADGHAVVLHARSEERAEQALAGLRDAGEEPVVLTGDLTSMADTRRVALAAAEAGPLDAVVHNAGVGAHDSRVVTDDGLERTFQVNVVAPYLLTALVPRPDRLVYLSSGTQQRGEVVLDDLQRERRPWDGMGAYSDSKLCDVVLALGVARRWPDVVSNAVDPGWIRTQMGGPSATGELSEGADTPVWLATSRDEEARVSGRYLHRRREQEPNRVARDHAVQDGLLAALEDITGTALPER